MAQKIFIFFTTLLLLRDHYLQEAEKPFCKVNNKDQGLIKPKGSNACEYFYYSFSTKAC